MRTPLLIALTVAALAFAAPPAAADPVCMGSTCPGGILMCIEGLESIPACADLPTLYCPQIWFEFSEGPVTVGYGPCTNVHVAITP